jgi:hypothetical protein
VKGKKGKCESTMGIKCESTMGGKCESTVGRNIVNKGRKVLSIKVHLHKEENVRGQRRKMSVELRRKCVRGKKEEMCPWN